MRGGQSWLAKLLFALSLVFLGFGLVSLGWYAWPAPIDGVRFEIPAGVLPGAPAESGYASQEDYVLAVEWPVWVRLGETGTIRVSLLEAGDSSGKPAEDQEAQVVLAEPAIAGLPLEPAGRVQAAVAGGQDLVLEWAVTGLTPGEHPGKIAVSFGFYEEALEELVPVPVAVVDAGVRVVSLWGLEARLVLWFGLVGLALWGALFVLGRVVEGR